MLKCVTDAQIRAARGLLAWTVDDVANRSGVQQATISAIESGQSPGEPQVCDALARTFEEAGVILLGRVDGLKIATFTRRGVGGS